MILVAKAFQRNLPDIIVDPQDLMKNYFERIPALKAKYKKDGEKKFAMSVSREDLANLVGTATETVIRTLSDFKEDKFII